MIKIALTIGALACVAVPLISVAAPARAEDKTAAASGGQVYVPPLRGAPKTRMGGATRGSADGLPELAVLAPDHTGHTATDQPTLYWYLSAPVDGVAIEISATNEDTFDTLFETRIERSIGAGVHKVSLADLGIKLEGGAEYRWAVALVLDEAQRSKDIVSSATIRYVGGPSGAAAADAASLARQGIWYDAIDRLFQDDDQEDRQLRAALLSQVELPEVAAYARRTQ